MREVFNQVLVSCHKSYCVAFWIIMKDRDLTSCKSDLEQAGFLACLLEIRYGRRLWVRVLFSYMVWPLSVCVFSLMIHQPQIHSC